jgi:DNA-binding MarR family transcriptional regulator
MEYSVDPEDFVGYTVVRLAHVLSRKMDEVLAPSGLNSRQFSTLILLATTPDISGGALARLVLVTPQSMSEMIAGLVAAGLVKREGARTRGKAMPISLTRAGRRALGKAMPAVAELERACTAHLAPLEAKLLKRQLLGILEIMSPDSTAK